MSAPYSSRIQIYTILVGDRHLRIVPHLSLSHHLGYLRWWGSSQIDFICHVTIHFGWLWRFSGIVFVTCICLGEKVLTTIAVIGLLVLLRGHVGKLRVVILRNDNVVIKGLVDDRLDRFALLLRFAFLVILPTHYHNWVVETDFSSLFIWWDNDRVVELSTSGRFSIDSRIVALVHIVLAICIVLHVECFA